MALLAEELVEEWLNRQGYFTIRGVKLGVDEIDLLAVKFNDLQPDECRHIEVQASMRPIGYISRILKILLKPGQSRTSAAVRTDDVLRQGVSSWVDRKYTHAKKTTLLKPLFQSTRRCSLVRNNIKSQLGQSYIAAEGIEFIPLSSMVKDLGEKQLSTIFASEDDFADLIHLAKQPPMTENNLMLASSKLDRYKNLAKVDIRYGPFTCIAGAKAVAKSSLFSAIDTLAT